MTATGRELARLNRIWISLPLSIKAATVVLGILIAMAWCIVAVALGIVLYESPMGCPPTTGCEGLKTTHCSASGSFGWHAANRNSCDE
jgi:hypothetical protein